MGLNRIINHHSEHEFKRLALEIFRFQAENNSVYHTFLKHLNINTEAVDCLSKIPFLPVEFFKSHHIVASDAPVQMTFLSSGTTGSNQSKHCVTDLSLYTESYTKGFEYFYGNTRKPIILALLPAYLERKGSSLIYMVNDLIQQSNNTNSGFYLDDFKALATKLNALDNSGEKVVLIGVSFALLDFVEQFHFNLKNTIIMETGGMKGRRKELIRHELHSLLKKGFGVSSIHSEYGMTELLSQAYSKGDGLFRTPPWMKVSVRDPEDPLTLLGPGKTGGINIIDLANINSCAFIATQDLGKTYTDGSFEVLGRFDHSDIRGCSLLLPS